MKNYVHYLTGNHILNVAILAWASAQLIKTIVVLITEKKLDWTRLIGTGGMPSSHSAIVMAVTVASGKICGFYSPEFAISLVFSMVVMYDAAGIRRAAGEQARILNYMMENWNHATPEMFQKELKELLGHTPVQVAAGALLGAAMGWLL